MESFIGDQSVSGSHKQDRHKLWYEGASCAQEVPAGGTNAVVVPNAKSNENREVRGDMSTGGGCFAAVKNKCHEDVCHVQDVPAGRNKGRVIINANQLNAEKPGWKC